MTAYLWHSIGLTAFCLLAAGRIDAGIIIESDNSRPQRDSANAPTTIPAATSIGSIPVAKDANHSTRSRTQRNDSQPAATLAESFSDGQFRLFSSDVKQRSDAITEFPHAGSSPQQKANVIADGLRHSGDPTGTHSQADYGIQIPATPAVDDEEIVAALFALPEPSTLSLAILGAALATAMPLRRWRKRRQG